MRTPPMVIGKMQVQRTLVIGLKMVPASQALAWAGGAPRLSAMVAATMLARNRQCGERGKRRVVMCANLAYNFKGKAWRRG